MPGARRRNKPVPAEDRQQRLADLRAEIADRAKGLPVLRALLADAPEGSHYQFAMRQLVAASDAVFTKLIDECDRLSQRPDAEKPTAKKPGAKKPRAKVARRRR